MGIIIHSYLIRRKAHEMYPAPDGWRDAEYILTTTSLSDYLIFSGFILKASNLWKTFFYGILNSERIISELK